MKSSEPSDDVAAMRRLYQQAWGDAYDRYVTSTYAFIAHLVEGDRALAEELHREAWMTAMSAIDQFAPEQGEFRAWLFGIARRDLSKSGWPELVALDVAPATQSRPRYPWCAEHSAVVVRRCSCG